MLFWPCMGKYFCPPQASVRLEVKNNYAHVKMQRILFKIIEKKMLDFSKLNICQILIRRYNKFFIFPVKIMTDQSL